MPPTRFVMNDVSYDFHCVRKEDGLLRFVLRMIDECYLLVDLFLLICAYDIIYVSTRCLTVFFCGAGLSADRLWMYIIK